MARSASPRPRGRPQSSARPADRSRGELLAAAADLFAELGFDGTSVRQICDRANLSKGTFYWTFPSKDALFLVLMEERIEAPIRAAIEVLRSAAADRDMSAETNQRFLDVIRDDRHAVMLDDEYWRRALRVPEIQARYAKRQRELRAALGEALDERRRTLGGPEYGIPAEHLAITFLALLSGIARSRLVDPEGIPDNLFGEFLAITYAGLVARAEGA